MVKIENVIHDNVEKVDIIDVKVITNPTQDQYIVADETGFILLISDQILKADSSYKLIKPKYNQNMILEKNPKFKAVKIEVKMKINKLSEETEKRLMGLVDNKHKDDNIENLNDFSKIQSLGVNSIAPEIIVLVTNISSVISGKFGNYRITSCKDIKNQKNSINLYRDFQGMVKAGQSYKISYLKICNLKKEGQDFNRLGTTYATRIVQASQTEENLLKKMGVILGDKMVNGTILGVANLKCYESCVKCWCRVDEDDRCRKCNKTEEKQKNFNIDLYIQSSDDTDNILDLFVFKSLLDLTDLEEEIDEDLLNKRLAGQTCYAEYLDIKESDSTNQYKIVKFNIVKQ